MSSAMIQQQISQCEADIFDCKERIRQKERILTKAEEGYNDFLRERRRLEDSFSNADAKERRIEAFEGVNVVAKRYREKMQFFHGAKRGRALDALDNNNRAMRKAIERTYDELEALKRELGGLETRLYGLRAAYSAAVQREAEEAAAAVAAQANHR